MKSRKRFLCLDCKVDTGKIKEHYFIKTDVWLSVAQNGMLCINCLENRLGRKLNKHDFTDCFINDPKHNSMSHMLLNRLTSCA